jgi:hypothetical protein
MITLLLSFAMAQDLAEPETVEEVAVLVEQTQSMFQAGDYTAGAALLLMLVVFLIRKFLWKSIPGKYIPYVTIATATAVEVSVALYAGEPVVSAVMGGLSMGLAAVGGWEAVGRKLLKSSPVPVAEEAAAEE